MTNWQETINQNFGELYAKYNKVLSNLNLTHGSFLMNYNNLYFEHSGILKPRRHFAKNPQIIAFWNFAHLNKLGTLETMKYFLDKVTARQNMMKTNLQQIQQPIPQQQPIVPQIPQPIVQQISQPISSETLKPNNQLFQNSEMSGFDEYANAYKANIGKGKSEERELMRKEADSVLEGMSPEEIKVLAKRYLVSGAKSIAADPDAQYGGYDVMRMDQNTANAILAKPKNAWAKFIAEQPSDIKFRPNMLHDDYSAWYAAKNGLQAWKGDFNSDGVADYMITDERGKIKYYNGYGLTPSKQAQYIKYNEQNPFSKNEKGAPYRPATDPSFREWTAGHARYLQEHGTLETTNKTLSKGMVKYKPRYKTVAEIVKDMLNDDAKGTKTKPIDQLMAAASNNNAAMAKAIKKTCNITKLVSLVLKPVLLKISQGDANLLNDVKALTAYIQKEVQPVLNVQNDAWLNLKMAIATEIVSGIATIGTQILTSCYQGVDEASIMQTIYSGLTPSQQLATDFAGAKAAKEGMKAAWKEAHPKTKALGSVKQSTKGRKTFDPQAASNIMEIDDEE